MLQRAVWKSVKFFKEYFDLSQAQAYQIIHMENAPIQKVGEKGYRVDMSRIGKFMNGVFGGD